VTQVPDKGRGLVASRFIREGELVLIDEAVLKGPSIVTCSVCPSCLAPIKKNYRCCRKCGMPVCDSSCEENPIHKNECTLLSANKVRFVTDDVSQPCSLYSFITPYRLLKLKDSEPELWDRVASLKDHLEERVGLVEFDCFHKDVVQFLRRRCFLASEYTEEEIHRAIGIILVNGVSLEPRRLFAGPVKGLQGKGVFPIFALLNHSCISNLKFTIKQDGPKSLVRVYARRNIEEGEELTVQYYSSLLGTHKRRRRLRSEWYFNCQCQRCQDPTELGTMVSAVACEVCETGHLLPRNPLDELGDWLCSSCDFFLEVPDLERKIDQLEEELNILSVRQDAGKLSEFIREVSGSTLHPNHYLLLLANRNAAYINRRRISAD